MKIIVLTKRVPDTGTPIKVKGDGSGLDLSSIPFVMNPYDEYALEAALKVKEKKGEGEIVLLAVGNDEYKETIRHGLAMGADRAKLIKVENPFVLDAIQVANLLLEEIKKEEPDAVFCGKKAVDDERSYVHAFIAQKMNYSYLYGAVNIDFGDDKLKIMKETERGLATFEVPFPCLISFDKCQFEARYPSLRGIMAAKKKPLEELEVQNIPENRVVSIKFEPPPPKKPGKIIDLPFPDNVKELVRLLKEEAKVL